MVIFNYNDLFLNLFCGQDNIASASIQTHDATNTFKLKAVITYMKLELFCGSRSNYTIQFSLYSSNIV